MSDAATTRRLTRVTGRARDWLVVVCVLLAIGSYWTVWVHYVKVHTVTRYVAAAPGAPYVTDGQTLRVLRLTRTTTLTSDNDGAEPQVASAGAEFVVAELELTLDHPVEYPECSPVLVGPDQRVWERASLDVSRDLTVSCSDAKVGVPLRAEVVYEVPSVWADQLYGLAVDDPTVVRPALVISPPA